MLTIQFKWHSLAIPPPPLIKSISECRPLILFNHQQHPLCVTDWLTKRAVSRIANYPNRVILAWPVGGTTTHNQLIIILFGRNSPHPIIYFCRPPSQRAAAVIEEEEPGKYTLWSCLYAQIQIARAAIKFSSRAFLSPYNVSERLAARRLNGSACSLSVFWCRPSSFSGACITATRVHPSNPSL